MTSHAKEQRPVDEEKAGELVRVVAPHFGAVHFYLADILATNVIPDALRLSESMITGGPDNPEVLGPDVTAILGPVATSVEHAVERLDDEILERIA